MISQELFATLKHQLTLDEGKRYKPYKCTSGRITIGIGRNLQDVGVSETTIDQMFTEDVNKCFIQAKQLFGNQWDTFSTQRQSGIINMIFNLGYAGFSSFRLMITAIKNNDREKIRYHGANSLWAKQVGLRAQRVLSSIAEELDIYPNQENGK